MLFSEVFMESVKKTPREGEFLKNFSLEPNEKLYKEAVRYLGYKNNAAITPEINLLVQKGLTEICATINSRAIYRYFSIQVSADHCAREDNSRECYNLPLRQYEGIILMGATLGISVDRLLSRAQIQDMAYALVIDSCATAAIEAICDDLQDRLKTIYAHQQRYLTNRYSPGYGNVALSTQVQLLRMLDAERKIGLHTTQNFLLTPSKSVTAMIGVSQFWQKNEYISCDICKMRRICHFRREGEHNE
ncbi:MAG: hypothetical protein LBB12_01870 [Holosporaceae bacterium]|jgi:hypothetical protein|nr:hypothetical protein [Holosporaceae bacterium]